MKASELRWRCHGQRRKIRLIHGTLGLTCVCTVKSCKGAYRLKYKDLNQKGCWICGCRDKKPEDWKVLPWVRVWEKETECNPRSSWSAGYGEGSSPSGHTAISSLCLLMADKEPTFAGALLYKGTNLTVKSALMNLVKPNYLPQVSLPSSTTEGIRALEWEFDGSVQWIPGSRVSVLF